MGARSGADHRVQANALQCPWPPRPLVRGVLWPSLAWNVRGVARFGREFSRLKGTFPKICAMGQLLEQAYWRCRMQEEVGAGERSYYPSQTGVEAVARIP